GVRVWYRALQLMNDQERKDRGVDVFFFQAEDGIRDRTVTGVQTCALPISPVRVTSASTADTAPVMMRVHRSRARRSMRSASTPRSEERRVGKECSVRWARD